MTRRPTRRARRMLAALVAGLLTCALAACGAAHHGTVTHSATAPSPAGPVTTAHADPVGYGMSDAEGEFASCQPGDPDCCDVTAGRCPLSRMSGYFDAPLFLRLLTPASAHRVRYVRLFVPYDAVSQFNGSTASPGCEYSQVRQRSWSVAGYSQPAGQAIGDLIAGVIEARADGLVPLVAIDGYPFAGLRPPGDAPFPDPTTTAGYWAYRCGLQGILGELGQLPAWEQPHLWEALNEPETFPIFNGPAAAPASQCAVGAVPQPDGPAKAACVDVIASKEIRGFAGHHADTVMPGAFRYLSTTYAAAYVAEIAHQMPGAGFPQVWSVHDYHEVTAAYQGGGDAGLAALDRTLAAASGGRVRSLWITEAGTVLTSTVRSGDCPAAGVDAAGSLGACVSGQAARQLAGADAFFSLPAAASAVPITHLFWYQFTAAPLWDSGLVDASGVPRLPYCVFYGSGSCPGNPTAF